MKKRIFLIFIIISTVLLPSCTPSAACEDCIRIHIRANSNSETDQSVKMQVKDELVDILTPVLAACSTKSEAYSAISENLGLLKTHADKYLKNAGFDYSATVSLRKEKFPAREYLGTVYSSGTYDALIIELGNGDGDNWWCVAFPPLCFVPQSDSENFRYKSKILEIIEKCKKEYENDKTA